MATDVETARSLEQAPLDLRSLDGAGEVRVYETESGKLLHKLAGQKGAVYAVAFTTSGKLVASGGFDGLVRIDAAETGALVKEFVPAPISSDKVATQR